MSSRDDRRGGNTRRERSWEKDDRDRDRGGDRRRPPQTGYNTRRRSRSRSKSPVRRGERTDHGRRDDRRGNDWDKEHGRRDDRRDDRRGDDRKDGDYRRGDRDDHRSSKRRDSKERDRGPPTGPSYKSTVSAPPKPKDATAVPPDGDEAMKLETADDDDVAEEDADARMMTMMGFGGFTTSKGKQVEGNQEGSANIKKQRTWRQYMNRRGGFNRPLDKIK